MDVDLRHMRKPYLEHDDTFEKAHLLSKEPFENFRQWFNEACDCKSIYEPNAMSVATATKDGRPSVRILLLKGFDKTGFKFFTNYTSRKGEELESNPHVALNFYWNSMTAQEDEEKRFSRQVRVEGVVEKLSREESEKYFQSRPRTSQINGTISPQSKPIPDKQFLKDRADELKERYPDESQPLPLPENWGGYLLRPDVIEFWQGQTSRLHDRIRFRRPQPGERIDPEITHEGEDGWVYEQLAP